MSLAEKVKTFEKTLKEGMPLGRRYERRTRVWFEELDEAWTAVKVAYEGGLRRLRRENKQLKEKIEELEELQSPTPKVNHDE